MSNDYFCKICSTWQDETIVPKIPSKDERIPFCYNCVTKVLAVCGSKTWALVNKFYPETNNSGRIDT